MAKPKVSNTGSVKIRFIEVEVSGTDETLQDGLKSIAAAMARGGTLPAARQLKSDAAEPQAALPVDAGEPEMSDEPPDGEAAPPIARKASGKRATASRKTGPMKILEFDFDGVSPTLEEFWVEKGPDNNTAQVLVMAYWYKNERQLPDLTTDHFHTAFRHLKKPTPETLVQVLSELKKARSGKMDPTAPVGTYRITVSGENAVIAMTGS